METRAGVAGSGGMDNAIVGFQYRNPPCVRQFTRSFLRHNHVVVVALIPSAPGVARRAAQPRALWHNAVGVALIYPEKPQKPQQRPVFIGWNACFHF